MTRRTGRLAAVAVAAGVSVIGGGGYALAKSEGGTVTACVSKSDHTLYTGKCARHDARLSWNQRGPRGRRGVAGRAGAAGERGATGATGATGLTGAIGPAGPQGVAGAAGTAKAYGYVTAAGAIVHARSSANVTAVTTVGAGVYCVTVTGVSSTTEGAVASPDYGSDSSGSTNIANVEWDAGSCPNGQFEFITSEVSVVAGALANTFTNQPFFFVVP